MKEVYIDHGTLMGGWTAITTYALDLLLVSAVPLLPTHLRSSSLPYKLARLANLYCKKTRLFGQNKHSPVRLTPGFLHRNVCVLRWRAMFLVGGLSTVPFLLCFLLGGFFLLYWGIQPSFSSSFTPITHNLLPSFKYPYYCPNYYPYYYYPYYYYYSTRPHTFSRDIVKNIESRVEGY